MLVPQNKDAEEAVLACCIIGEEENVFDKARRHLKDKDFYLDEHRDIWEAMVQLRNKSVPIDEITLSEELGDSETKHLPMLMANKVQTTLSLMHYIDILLEKSRLRTIRSQYSLALERMKNNDESQDILDAVHKELDKHVPREKETTHIESTLDEIQEEFDQMASGEYKHEYIKTHIPHLDEKIKLELGTVFTIAAPTSVGKSALSLNIAMKSASKDKFPVLIFSLEMPQKQISKRMLGALSKTNLKSIESNIKEPSYAMRLKDAGDKLRTLPIHTVHSVKSVDQIASDVRRFKQRYGIKLVVIDYLQLVPFNADKMQKADGVAMISQRIKQVALDCNVCVLLLSQLNREGATSNQPSIFQLKDSGSIENDCDICLLMNYKNNDMQSATGYDNKGQYSKVNYFIGKNREGESQVRGEFKFYACYGIFY
jgi:replicative DNA helicase